MGWNQIAMQEAASFFTTNVVRAHLHSADPGVDGVDNLTAAPGLDIVWSEITGFGDFGLGAPLAFVGVEPNGTCAYLTAWNNAENVCYGIFKLANGTGTANAEGEFTVSMLNFGGASS